MKYLISFLLVLTLSACKKKPYPDEKNNRIVVYNKGVSGNVSAQLAERLETDVLTLKPKLVIILIGTNDVSKNIPYNYYKANVTTVVNRIQQYGAKVLLLSPPPRGTTEITNPHYFANDRNDKINLILDTLSQNLNCYYLDINKAFKYMRTPNANASSFLFNEANKPANPDGIHLTNAGAMFLAQQVAQFIANNNLTSLNVVVCFGDSLTAISGYPGYLQDTLNSSTTNL
jgi:lysophospholipase L1-like esterase